jgi:transformation/transcription domain-associated protein
VDISLLCRNESWKLSEDDRDAGSCFCTGYTQLYVCIVQVYYPVRHHLVQHMVNSIQRLGFSPTGTIEHRKLAVELSEVIIKWELHRIKDESDAQDVSDNLAISDNLIC